MGRRFSRVPALVAAGVLVAVGVSGCQSNPEPKALPSKAPVSTAAASPVAAAPTMPAAARGTGPKAAKAFVRFYVASVNHAALSGNTKTLKTTSSPGCKSCRALVSNIDSVYGQGGHIEHESWRLISTRVIQANEENAVASVTVDIGREVIVLPSGKTRVHHGGKQPMTMFMNLGPRPVLTRLDLVAS